MVREDASSVIRIADNGMAALALMIRLVMALITEDHLEQQCLDQVILFQAADG